ncbi:hypothetical protein BH23ACT9_BH23ACT9_31060 [soil metagenome]
MDMDVNSATPAEDDQDAVVDVSVPDHAHVVVVPVSNPHTAPELLTLARALVRADGGKVIVAVVVLGDADAEQNIEKVEALRSVVEDVTVDGGDIEMELLTRPAVSIARGILDVALDEGADMILLGVQAPTPSEVAVGGVAESVIDAAHCDVLVYRRGRHGGGLEQLERIVVAVDGSPASRAGARVGIILGQGLESEVQVMHVRRPGQTEQQALDALDRAIGGLTDAESCERVTVNAVDPARGLRSAIGPRHLAVLGFENLVRFDGKHMGATTMAAMDTLRGPVIAVSRPARATGSGAWVRRLSTRMRPQLTAVEEEALIWQARVHATLTPDFIVLCVLSSLIATFGLLLNSAAVIIGAMLVAPLMSPLIAFGTTMVDGDTQTLRRAGTTVFIGTFLVGGTALLVGLITGSDPATPEMTSRGSPSLIDAGVAVASGMVGAYASARKGIPAALAGVAIAAALVPPICVFGLALTTDGRLATGAGLLFMTNIACMAVASAVVLIWLGLRVDRAAGRARMSYLGASALLLLSVLGALVLFGLAAPGLDLRNIRGVVEEAMPGVEVITVDDLGADQDVVTVTIRASEDPSPAAITRAVQRVAETHGGLRLRLVVERLLLGG